MPDAAIVSAVSALTGDAPAAALSLLVERGKKLEARRETDALLGDRHALLNLLRHPAPKTRKNAARLLGTLAHPEDGQALALALNAETTLFVLPSLLLALGSVGGDAAKAALAAYIPPAPKDESEKKHCGEIADAFRKAKGALLSSGPLPVYAPAKARVVLLTAPAGFAPTLWEELRELSIPVTQDPRGALVAAKELAPLFRARCFSELLLPVGEGLPCTAASIAAAVQKELTLPYRVEIRAEDGDSFDRRSFLAALLPALGGDNSPSHYALELRIQLRGNLCDLYIKPSLPFDRFAYRKQALPASIAPALAACLARVTTACYEKRLADAGASPLPIAALDPFCGSGALLFELEKRLSARKLPCRTLIGSDISSAAVAIARENGTAAGSAARFLQKDALRLAPKEPFQLILSNLPFGNRVGSHETNERLYRGLIQQLPNLLAESGVALLYTMEYRLLHDCLKGASWLTLLSQRRTEAGGLLPWMFLIARAGNPAFLHKKEE